MMIEFISRDPGPARLARLLQSGADPNIPHDVSICLRECRPPPKFTIVVHSLLSSSLHWVFHRADRMLLLSSSSLFGVHMFL